MQPATHIPVLARVLRALMLALAGLCLATPSLSQERLPVAVAAESGGAGDAAQSESAHRRTAGAQKDDEADDEADDDDDLTPEEKMERRFPQPVRAGFLVGLPVLDWNDSTIGHIERVVRTGNGKIQLVVPYASHFGWWRHPWFVSRRPVAVPIEVVAILARQVDALDMLPKDFAAAPTFDPSQATDIPPDEMIRIAVTRR